MSGTTLVLIVLTVYFLPSGVAVARSHHQAGAIIVLNVLAGWTGIGWIAAIVWAATRVQPRMTVIKSS